MELKEKKKNDNPINRIENLKTEVSVLQKVGERHIIQGYYTYIAFKDTESFLIGSSTAGIKLVEKGELVCMERFNPDNKSLEDIVYIPELNCYFLCFRGGIYRKNISGKRFFKYLGMKIELDEGKCLKYSQMNRNLVFVSRNIIKSKTQLVVHNLLRKKIVSRIDLTGHEKIASFKIFGPRNRMLAVLTKKGTVIIRNLKTRKMFKTKIDFEFGNTSNQCRAFDITPDGRFLVLEAYFLTSTKTQLYELTNLGNLSRVLAAENDDEGPEMVLRGALSQPQKESGVKMNLRFVGHNEDDGGFKEDFLVILTFNSGGYCMILLYDKIGQNFKELIAKRFRHGEIFPWSVSRLADGSFYYTGGKSTISRIKLTM